MTPSLRQLLSDPILLLGFGFGSGLSPKAPGTAGTALALPFLYLALAYLDVRSFLWLTAAMSLVGIPICGLSSQKLGVHDHGGIVWDEFAGLFVTAIPLMLWPQSAHTGLVLLLAFVWFRIFDVLKPWPIRLLDKHVHGGLGIMVDDLLAGVFAGAALWLSLKLLP